MKTKYLTYGIFLTIVLLTSVQCSHINKRNRLVEVTSGKAIKLVDKTIESYDKIDSITYTEKYNNDFIAIVENTEADTNALPDFPRKDFAKELRVRKKAFELLKAIYLNLKFTNIHRKTLTSNQAKALSNSYKQLGISSKYPDVIKESFEEQASRIKKLSKTNNIKEHLDFIQELTTEYQKTWIEDLNKWKQLSSQIYKNYKTHLENMPVEAYDVDKIKVLLAKEPYTNRQVLVNIYKLQLRQQALNTKNQIEINLDAITEALNLIIKTFDLLAQENCNELQVKNNLMQIDYQLQRIQ